MLKGDEGVVNGEWHMVHKTTVRSLSWRCFLPPPGFMDLWPTPWSVASTNSGCAWPSVRTARACSAWCLAKGMRISVAGLAVGIVAALLSTPVLAGFLYGVEPNDPTTLFMTSVVLVLVSAAACLAPVRRATAVDPVRVLKAE